MSRYLLIPRLEIRNANAQPAWWLIGAPPPTAFHGFAHALGRATEATPNGVGIVHHDIQFLGEEVGNRLHPHQFRAAGLIDKDDYSSKNAHVLSSQPTARCHLTASLVIRFSDAEGDNLSQARVERFLAGARLAGGNVLEHGKLGIPSDWDGVEKALRRWRGFALHERQDLMVKQPGERDFLDVLLRLTRPTPENRQAYPWLMPTTLGYRAISPIERRVNSRQNLPHAYAEPLVGLVQYRPLRDGGLPIWEWRHDPARDRFILTAPTPLHFNEQSRNSPHELGYYENPQETPRRPRLSASPCGDRRPDVQRNRRRV